MGKYKQKQLYDIGVQNMGSIPEKYAMRTWSWTHVLFECIWAILSFDLGEFRWHVQPSVALEDPQTSQRVATSQKMEWFEIPKELPS